MQNQLPSVSLLAKPFDRPPLPSFAIWLLSVPSLPMAVLYRDATLWEPRVVQIPLFVIVRLYTPIGNTLWNFQFSRSTISSIRYSTAVHSHRKLLTVQILYNYTVGASRSTNSYIRHSTAVHSHRKITVQFPYNYWSALVLCKILRFPFPLTKSLYFIVGGEFPRGESSSQYKSYIITLAFGVGKKFPHAHEVARPGFPRKSSNPAAPSFQRRIPNTTSRLGKTDTYVLPKPIHVYVL